MTSIKLKIDNREVKLRQLLNDNSINHEIIFENLSIGDFIFECNGVPIIVLERKTLDDLAMSIKDNRWKNQKINLLENFQRNMIYFIIEGDWNYKCEDCNYKGLPKTNLKGSIINTLIRDDIKIIWTHDLLETKDLLIYLIEKLSKDYHKLGFGEQKIKDNQIEIHKDKSTNLTQDKFFNNCLLQIPGISKITSKSILSNYSTLPLFYESLNKLNREEKINTLSRITCGEKERKLSRTVIINLVKYFFE